MRFAIIKGLPYLISNGTAFPVRIDGSAVTVSQSQAFRTDETGKYCLQEIKARCATLNSIKDTARKKKKAEPAE